MDRNSGKARVYIGSCVLIIIRYKYICIFMWWYWEEQSCYCFKLEYINNLIESWHIKVRLSKVCLSLHPYYTIEVYPRTHCLKFWQPDLGYIRIQSNYWCIQVLFTKKKWISVHHKTIATLCFPIPPHAYAYVFVSHYNKYVWSHVHDPIYTRAFPLYSIQ